MIVVTILRFHVFLIIARTITKIFSLVGNYVYRAVFLALFQDVQLHYLHHHPTYIHDYALCMHDPHAYSVDNVIETLLAP